jgi:hypothetical protein
VRATSLCCFVCGVFHGFFAADPVYAVSEVRFRIVAQSGFQAPGMPEGVNFSGFSNPRINDAGQVVVRATLTGPGVTTSNDRTLWFENGGGLQLVAREGTAAPAAGTGVTFGEFPDRPDLSNNGATFFQTILTGNVDTTNDSSIWSDSGSGAQLFAREGLAAPGVGDGITFAGFDVPIVGRSGEVMLTASLAGTGIDATNGIGIWSNAGGSLHPVVRLGSAAPGTAAGTTFATFSDGARAIDSAGQVGFIAQVAGPGIDSSNDRGIWQEQGGNLTLLAREGAPAPGTEAGTIFSNINSPNVSNYNGRGRLPIRAVLSGPNVTSANDEGIWAQTGGNLHLVWREGTPVPGVEPGLKLVGLPFRHLEFNDAGELTFLAGLTGPGVTTSNDSGIWSTGGGTFHLVAREGMATPGTISGVTFSNFGEYGDPVISDAGHVAFYGEITGPGSVPGNFGLWAEGTPGLQLVTRSEPGITLPSGGTASFSSIDFFRGSGIPSSLFRGGTVFNNRDQLTFRVVFKNTTISAVVVADLTPFQPGDYNGDGVVDTADYVVWRNTLGSTSELAADGTGNGIIDEGDWVIWRQNFGETITDGISGAASATGAATPEPGACLLLMLGAVSLSALRRSRRSVVSCRVSITYHWQL